MLFSLSGIDPLNWLFATFLHVILIIGSLIKRYLCNTTACGNCANLQVRQREISEDIYRTCKLVVLQITEDIAFRHRNFEFSVLIWIVDNRFIMINEE